MTVPHNGKSERRFPIGAELCDEGVHFRLWAPKRRRVQAVVKGTPDDPGQILSLDRELDGHFSGFLAGEYGGALYGFRLDDDSKLYPDPASRFQPDGPHGLSQIVDPGTYAWRDNAWQGVRLKGQIIYELHIGTFTAEGTWQSAINQLPRLADLGVTLLEVMPVADFPGNFGWGYDGVNLFAPTRLYGSPEDFRAFVDAAHAHRLGVLLDVVYNHFGPSGNYIGQFSDDYLSHRHHTDWGDAINYDGENSPPVREFFCTNAAYWVSEFHLDGLRLDAVQAVFDESENHILASLCNCVRKAAAGRDTIVVVENEFQETRLLRDVAERGCGIDAAWNDDFHHSARVAATGCADYYYGDYRGTPQELISAVKWGHLYQGQWNSRQERHRGGVTWGLPAARFVNCLQNHDQVGNSPGGKRLQELTSPGRYRALTALLLLSPGTPMLFQGQEFATDAPFHYFADHEPELAKLVREGRKREMGQFRRQTGDDTHDSFIDPCARETFECCKLNVTDSAHDTSVVNLHRDLLRLRREDPVFASQNADRMHGAVLGDEAFVLRFFGVGGDDRLLIVNLGRDMDGHPLSEPLLAPPSGSQWKTIWSSEDASYGGLGAGDWNPAACVFTGNAAVVLAPERAGAA